MSAAVKSLVGSMILVSLIALAYGGTCIYTARQDTALAGNEGTASAQVFLQPPSQTRPWASSRCDYTFSVNGNLYPGYGMCPQQDAAHPAKAVLPGPDGVFQNSSATVYFDPANPSTNSLVEFGVKAEGDYLRGKVSVAVGLAILVLLGVGALYAITPGSTSEGVVVDSEGTVIYPDKVDSGQEEFSAHPTHIGSEEEQSEHF